MSKNKEKVEKIFELMNEIEADDIHTLFFMICIHELSIILMIGQEVMHNRIMDLDECEQKVSH